MIVYQNATANDKMVRFELLGKQTQKRVAAKGVLRVEKEAVETFKLLSTTTLD
ncbi:hypothetical protein VPHK567_0264 [Vibrio phage K567]|nr:hypothetical protein MYOV011v1_p0359 [Vibrio phage 6E35.1a]